MYSSEYQPLMKHKPLQPLPYHYQLVQYFQTRYPAVWQSFHAAHKAVNRRTDIELNLLKTSVRLPEADNPALYEVVERARQLLEVEQPIILYQSHRGHQDNASMHYTEEQGHLKFEGEILSSLRQEEIAALIGHEVGHYKLWATDNGDHRTCARLLETMNAARDVHSSLQESHRIAQLYTEIFCDRAGAMVAGRLEPMVSALVRVGAGDVMVTAEDYIAQVEEIYQKSADECSHGQTHPECFIRARALSRWVRDEQGEEAVNRLIKEMIEGRKELGRLDAVARDRLTGWTQRIVRNLSDRVRVPQDGAWSRHRERFLPLHPANPADENSDLREICQGLVWESETVRDYFVFLLMDFAVVDPSVKEAMKLCKDAAIALGLGARFDLLTQRNLVALAA